MGYGISNKDLKRLIDKLVEAGWTATVSNGGHLRLTPPFGGRALYATRTPVSSRGVLNFRGDVRRLCRAVSQPSPV